MQTINVTWTGRNPMLMHNERLADPLDPYAKSLSALTSKRGNAKKTDQHAEELARTEWEGGLYYDDDMGPHLPGWNILAAIRSGAKLSKLGAEVTRSVQVVEDSVPVQYEGPRDLDGMWEAKMYLRCGVKVGQTKVMRTRPRFSRWSLQFSLAYDEARITVEDLMRVMNDAGNFTGLGDFRQRYGRFDVST